MDNLVELPLILKPEPKDRTGGCVELPAADPHQNRQTVLKALVVDPDGNLGLRGLREGVGILDVPDMQDTEGKRATYLSIGGGRDNLDVIAKLKIAALLG